MTIKLVIFALGTMLIVWVSRSNLLRFRQHGFYRFLAWQTILLLFVLNVDYWFVEPFSIPHLFAWALLILSLVLIVAGVRAFRQMGQIDPERSDQGLVGIEKTTQLVTSGIYGLIRHPFYASLLFLSWGIFFKNITLISILLTLLASIFLFITAKIEEGENAAYFGQPYQEYMKTTKMFLPFVI